jgi:hypothetical protein
MLPRPSGVRSNVGAPYSFMFSSFVAALKGGWSYLHLVTELLSGFDGSRNEGLQVRSHAEKYHPFVDKKI